MSNKGKNQQQSQQQQQTQQQLKNGMGPIPPRYQPPPAPKTINHHHIQAARLANQVKDAVQSKFPLGSQQPRMEKPGQNFGYHPNKAFIASPNTTPISAATGIPTLQGSSLSTTPTTPTSNTGIPILSNGPSMINHNVQSNPTNTGTTTTTRPQQQRLTDDDFLRLGPIEMLKFVRKTENDMARLANEHHRQVQALLNEIRVLKEANQRLSDDSQELRDLCCFLDDDRQKGRKLAREWQRFGRYTASVMRQEVSAYQNKLRQLDNKQQELIKDNLELKELCLYLDEERGGSNGSNNGGNGVQRDDGDGSSSSTNADENNPPPPRTRHISTFNDQMMQYVRSLEQRINQLEEDKTILQSRTQGLDNNTNNQNDNFHLGNRPEAVVRALQVLEVREQLEREAGHDEEKALVREMCNVVWRKLEEGPNQNRH